MTSPSSCRECDAPTGPHAKFCRQCGAAVAPDESLTWEASVPILTNRYLLAEFAKYCLAVVLLTGTLFGILFGVANGLEGVYMGLIAAVVGSVGLLGISFLIFAAIMGNRYSMLYSISERGVQAHTFSKRVKALNRLSVLAALATNRPLLAGPGIIAMSGEFLGIAWDEVRSIRHHPEGQVVMIRGGLTQKVHIHCSPENYEEVVRLIEKYRAERSSSGESA